MKAQSPCKLGIFCVRDTREQGIFGLSYVVRGAGENEYRLAVAHFSECTNGNTVGASSVKIFLAVNLYELGYVWQRRRGADIVYLLSHIRDTHVFCLARLDVCAGSRCF